MRTNEFDVVFISYDEPNAEENYAHLLNDVPWAKRVHGVKGLDNVHKEVAKIADGDRVITVDGDNIVHKEFWNLELDLDGYAYDCSFTWLGRNLINGLVYGNGGAKLWYKPFLENMSHHEKGVDFCWDEKYIHLPGVYSTTIQNGSAYQAFRAGFREGVKMSLWNGERIYVKDFEHYIEENNLNRLLVWLSVGIDVPYGREAIYGARLGCYYVNLDKEWDITNINNYDYILKTWNEWQPISQFYTELGEKLEDTLGITVANLDQEQSAFFKKVLIKTPLGDSLPDYYTGKYMIL